MREPSSHARPFGLMAEFNRPDRLIEAVRRTRKAGYRAIDAYSPFPVEGMEEVLGFQNNLVPWLALLGGLAGAAIAYGLQLYTNWAYQIEIGGRSLYAWQSFMLVTFELTVLFSVCATISGMLILNRLPRLHHPVFDVKTFHLASTDRFFLIVFSNDVRFDLLKTHRFLQKLDPVAIETVEDAEARR